MGIDLHKCLFHGVTEIPNLAQYGVQEKRYIHNLMGKPVMDEKPAVRLKGPRITEVPMKDLKARLDSFETKHGLSSEEFYRQAHAGLLDEQEEYITDYFKVWISGYFIES